MATAKRTWPGLGSATQNLLCLRDLLIAAIEPLNIYAEEGQAVHWDEKDLRVRKTQLSRVQNTLFNETQRKTPEKETPINLILATKGEKYWVRLMAIDALYDHTDQAAISALVEALTDKEKYIRHKAAESLQRVGAPAIPYLSKSLENRQDPLRERAAEVLRGIGDSTALSALLKALKNKDGAVRACAVRSIGHIGKDDTSAIRALINVLNDPHGYVEHAASQALRKLQNPQCSDVWSFVFSAQIL